MCNYSVNSLIKIDKKDNLLFAPLQGKTATKLLEKKIVDDLNSMAFYKNGKVYIKSTAVLKSIQSIGGIWRIFGVFLLLPSFIRDWIYNQIASIRYNFFGKLETCRVPSADEKIKILD